MKRMKGKKERKWQFVILQHLKPPTKDAFDECIIIPYMRKSCIDGKIAGVREAEKVLWMGLKV